MAQERSFRLFSGKGKYCQVDRHKDPFITWMDALVGLLLVICPILQNYRGLLVDARATVLVLLVPYLLWAFWKKNRINWVLVVPLIGYGILKIFAGGTSIVEIGREGLMCFYLLAVASEVVDTKKFTQMATVVALLASALIIVQYICYYIFDYHLQLVPTGLFLDSSEQWEGLAETGLIGITGKNLKFYRPSSFFLEPSHMAIYCIPTLLLLLLTPKMTKKRMIMAVVITVGIMASTSGMGIVLSMGLWFLYFALYFCEDRKTRSITIGRLKVNIINVVFVGALLVLFILMYLFVDVFRNSINRIFVNTDGSSALAGRTKSGANILRNKMGFLDFLLGKRNPGPEADWYMSAFYGTIYDYGIFAFVLSYVFYVYSLFKLKRQYFWMALMILGLSYFSVHTHGSSYMLYFCTFLLCGYSAQRVQAPFDLELQIHPFGPIKKRKDNS